MNKFIRKKRAPLPAWEDKVAAAISFDSRSDGTIYHEGAAIRVVVWHCHINMFGVPRPKDYTALTITSGHCHSDHLIITARGEICPKCKTNEYIVSQGSSLLPVSMREYDIGKMCLKCGTISQTTF